MARAKVILVDADVISHFIATDHIYELNEILSPHQLYIVDNVYKEATYHPSDKERKNKIDEWLKKSKACRISFPKLNRKIMAEFFKLKRDYKLLGDGECACMAMARFDQEAIASSNFRDVAFLQETTTLIYFRSIQSSEVDDVNAQEPSCLIIKKREEKTIPG